MVKRTREKSCTGNARTTTKRIKSTSAPTASHRAVIDEPTETCYYSNSTRRADKANFFLSPLFPCHFVCGGVVYRSVTHFMQSAKYEHDPMYQRVIRDTLDPVNALHLGKHLAPRPRKNESAALASIRRIIQNRQNDPDSLYRQSAWPDVRADLFRTATLCKFAQNPSLRRALLETQPAPIVEDSTDPDWGGRGDGLNMAGHALVHVRNLLLQEQQLHGGAGLPVRRKLFFPDDNGDMTTTTTPV